MVSSRSSVNFFTNGRPVRAVTFQSIVRTSSPGTYSRTSSKSMPRPLKTRVVLAGQRVGHEPARADFDLPHLLQDFAGLVSEFISKLAASGDAARRSGHRQRVEDLLR